ncbi:MAG: RsmE family RNA methyltransferase [Paenibacillaceae bacterium]
MQRYFIAREQFLTNTVQVQGDDAFHIQNVMRAKIGDQVIVADGEGQEAIAQIVTLSKGIVEATYHELTKSAGEARIEVWLAQALPKGDKMETVIQKGTEIGANRFIPFTSERTIVQYDAKKEAKRIERWARIAKEAAEQAHRGRIPSIDTVSTWRELLARVPDVRVAFICYEKEHAQQFRELLQAVIPKDLASSNVPIRIMLIVGPEGGLTEGEVREAEQAGCRTISLGRRILRTETAAMVGLSCILYESGEMGG